MVEMTFSWHAHPDCWSVMGRVILAQHYITVIEYTANAFGKKPPVSECVRAQEQVRESLQKIIDNNGTMPQTEG